MDYLKSLLEMADRVEQLDENEYNREEYQFVDLTRRMIGALNTYHGTVIQMKHSGTEAVQNVITAQFEDTLYALSKQLQDISQKFPD
jgi:hypothetical protein